MCVDKVASWILNEGGYMYIWHCVIPYHVCRVVGRGVQLEKGWKKRHVKTLMLP